jgi:hypothetical protein
MKWKKFLLSLLIVWGVFEVTSYLVHMVFLRSEYLSESLKTVLRPSGQLGSNMWLIWLADLVWCIFLILIYLKGFRRKGIADGLKYGVYIGIFCGFVNSFKVYALSPFPYIVIFYQFFFFMIQSVILGLILWYLYRKEQLNN